MAPSHPTSPTLTPGLRILELPDPDHSATDHFWVSSSRRGRTALVRAGGELDIATVPKLHATLVYAVSQLPEHVVLDLDELTYLDSSGLAILVALYRRTTADGCRLTIVCGGPQCQKVLKLTGLDVVLPFASSVQDALGETETGGDVPAQQA